MTIRFIAPRRDGDDVAATPARQEPRPPVASAGRPLPMAPRPFAAPPVPGRTSAPGSAMTRASAPGAATSERQSTLARAAPQPSAAPATLASDAPALKLVVRGFNAIERSLLEGTVRLSQRRTPRLQLLADTEVGLADVVMVDASDAQATQWAKRQTSLAGKAVIWVDGETAGNGHTLVRRPVQWPILPMLLARALEKGPAMRPASATPSPRAVPGSSAAPRSLNAPTPPVAAAASASASAIVARPILVVDDSLAVRNYLRSQLEARGFQVVEAASAQAAIDAVSATAFACVLMDVLMPGIDGYEGCKQIKARLRGVANVPVVMLTSKSSPFDRIRGKMAGCDAYLTKPVEPAQLHDVLAQHAGRPVRN